MGAIVETIVKDTQKRGLRPSGVRRSGVHTGLGHIRTYYGIVRDMPDVPGSSLAEASPAAPEIEADRLAENRHDPGKA